MKKLILNVNGGVLISPYFFFLLLIFPFSTKAQHVSEMKCGGYVKKATAKAFEGVPEFVDRFGNEYTLKELQHEMSYEKSMQCGTTNGAFNLVFSDNITQSQRDVVCAVFQYIETTVVGSSGSTVNIRVNKDNMGNNGTLATGSPIYSLPACGIHNSLVWEKINTASPVAGNIPDGVIDLNSSYENSWYESVVNATPGTNQYDLYTIVLHEALHVLGFASLIGQNGMSIYGDFYSNWDSHLRSSSYNNYLLSTVFDPDCCDAKYYNPLVPLDLDGCGASNWDVKIDFNYSGYSIFGLATSPDEIPNSLSHLVPNGSCDGSPNYVMSPSLTLGIPRRIITSTELDILHIMGYDNSNSCFAVANNDEFTVANLHETYVEFSFDELISNDFLNSSSYSIKIIENCGSNPSLDIVVFVDDATQTIKITGIGYDTYTFCYQLTSNGCGPIPCDMAFFTIHHKLDIANVPVLPPCPPAGCGENLFCYGDFNALSTIPGAPYNYQMNNRACPVYNGQNNNGNTGYTQVAVGENILGSGDLFPYIISEQSILVIPLNQGVQPGCSISVDFDTRATLTNIPPNWDVSLQVFGMQEHPCDIGLIPTGICDSDCNGPGYHCISGGDVPVPGNTTFSHKHFVWTNCTTDQVINYLVFAGLSNTPGANNNHLPIAIDNVEAIQTCDKSVTVEGDNGGDVSLCFGNDISFSYTICNTSTIPEDVDVTLNEIVSPEMPNLTFSWSPSNQATLSQGSCTTLVLSATNDEITESGSGAGLANVDNFMVDVSVLAPNTCVKKENTNSNVGYEFEADASFSWILKECNATIAVQPASEVGDHVWKLIDANGIGVDFSTLANALLGVPSPGNYTLFHEYTNDCGTEIKEESINVVWDSDFDVVVDQSHCTVCFTTNATQGNHTWDFGDNTSGSTEANPCHTYAASGIYTVVHTYELPGECTIQTIEDVTVNCADCEHSCGTLILSWQPDSNSPYRGRLFYEVLTCEESQFVNSGFWKWGDGTSNFTGSYPYCNSCGQNSCVFTSHPSSGYICHTFPGPGNYNIFGSVDVYNNYPPPGYCVLKANLNVMITDNLTNETGNLLLLNNENGMSNGNIGNKFHFNVDKDSPKKITQISLKPNPFTENVLLSFVATAQDENFEICVLNTDGRIAYNSKFIPLDGINNRELELKNLPNGVYLITLLNNGVVVASEKLIKQ